MIPIIQALSGDVEFIQAIDSKFIGIIHSVFDKTVNIKCLDTGDLYTLACNRLDNGPNSLVIDINSFSNHTIKLNDRVFTKGNILYVENKMSITLENINKWQSLLPNEFPEDEEIQKNIVIIKEHVGKFGKSGGVKKDLLTKNPFEIEMAKMLEVRIRFLLDALQNNQVSDAINHAVSLIGLGPGLTPSGDDFLTGLITTFHLANCQSHLLTDFTEKVLTSAQSSTNDISYMTLRLASLGNVRESIVGFINAAMNSEREELISALDHVLKIGSSSGTDIALGIVCGLEMIQKLNNRFH